MHQHARRGALMVATALLLVTGWSGPVTVAPVSRPASSSAQSVSPSAPPARAPSRPEARQRAPETIPLRNADPTAQPDPLALAPVRLEIDSREIAMPVVPVGVQDDGRMELPASVYDVGWYQYGAGPASATGSTVLAAHVDSREEGLGPFARLKQVREGSAVLLTTADGAQFRYVVSSVQSIDKTDVPLNEVFDSDGSARLMLITCGGAYDQGVGYSDNVIVTALPDKN